MDNFTVNDLIAKTADVAIRNTTETVFKRIDVARENKDAKKSFLALEEIINDLLADKNQLTQVLQGYEDVLSSQKISDENITYITKNVLPILQQILESDMVTEKNEEKAEEMNKIIEILEPIISVETLTIMQHLGFNFREAIGVPLTKLVGSLVNKEEQELLNVKYAMSVNSKEEELFKLLQTDEGIKIYEKIIQNQK